VSDPPASLLIPIFPRRNDMRHLFLAPQFEIQDESWDDTKKTESMNDSPCTVILSVGFRDRFMSEMRIGVCLILGPVFILWTGVPQTPGILRGSAQTAISRRILS